MSEEIEEENVDLNLVVLAGHLAAAPEWSHKTGSVETLRFLVTVRGGDPSRIDVIPVTLKEPHPDEPLRVAGKGDRIWVAGTIQRTFTLPTVGVKKSNVEIVALEVQLDFEPDESLLTLVTDDDKKMS